MEHDMEHDMEHRGGRYNTLARGAPGEKERERERGRIVPALL